MECSDPELIRKIKDSKDNQALAELISRHTGIYLQTVNKYGNKGLSYSDTGDILDEKDLNIYEAALRYDESKSKFSTYLANKTKYICLSKKSKTAKKNKKFCCLDDVDYCQTNSEDLNPYESSLFHESYERIFNLLKRHEDKRVETIFKMRYFYGDKNKLYPWVKIAEELNLSIQGCINIHDRTLKELQKIIQDEEIKY